MKILLVEDDKPLAQWLQVALTHQQYQIEVAIDGQTGWELAEAFSYDLILLDLMLPRLNGIQFCQRLRANGGAVQSPNQDTPVLLMTALDTITNKVMGLDAGADDYVVKPIDLEELQARIRALQRRSHTRRSPLLQWGKLCLQPKNCEVTYDGKRLCLSAKEYALLELFLRYPDQIFTPGKLIEKLWATDAMPTENAVRVHIKELRKKLRQSGAGEVIETVYKLGYGLQRHEGNPISHPDRAQQSVECLSSTAPIPWSSVQLKFQPEFQPALQPEFQPALQPEFQPALQPGLQSELWAVWQECRETYCDRFAVIEQAIVNLQADILTTQVQQQAEQEAHTLIGSLGSFGLGVASRLARQLQQMLKLQPLHPSSIGQLTQLVRALQQEIETPTEMGKIKKPEQSEKIEINRDSSNARLHSPFTRLIIDDAVLAGQLAAEAASWRVRAEVASLNQQQGECELTLQHLYAAGTDSHLAAIVASSGDAIISKSLDGKILSWNPAAERIFGYTAEEAIGQPISMLVPADRANDIPKILQRVRQGESIYHYATVRVRKDGQLIDVSVTASPIRDARGKVIAASVIKQDITNQQAALRERKAVEASLRQSEASLSAFIQAVPDLITRVQRDGTRIAILSGISNTLKPYPITANVKEIMPPVLVNQRLHYIQQAIDTQTLQVYEYSINLNGQLQHEEARIVAAGNDEAFVMVRNITDRKQAEASLRESNHRWQALLDNVQLVVVGLDQQGHVEYVNPFFLKLTGYIATEVIGQSWFDRFLPSHLRPNVRVVFQEMMQQEHFHAQYQNPILTKLGEERMIVWSNTLLHSTDGRPVGTISIGEDITDRYRLEQMKSEFISIVSHELRTPLTSMQAALSLLHEKIIDPASDDGRTIIHIATDGVDRLVRLVNDILDLERLESSKIRLEKKSCQTADLVRTAIDQMQEMANQAGVILNASPESFEIYADCDRLLQVLTNLLSNAIKFSSSGDQIWLSTELMPNDTRDDRALIPELPVDSVFFMVQDQGRGIPTDQLESIFEQFYQVDASDSREKGGTGLGLAICRSIVEQHGGHIWAESVLGEGSIFYVIVPVGEIHSDDYQANIDY